MPVDVQQLKGKIVFLRGMEAGDNLSFDAKGDFVGMEATEPFAYSVLKLDEIYQTDTKLQLQGKRMMLIAVFSDKAPYITEFCLVRIEKPIEISIVLDSTHPENLDSVIHKIFSFSLRDDLAGRSSDEAKAIYASLGLNNPPAELPDAAEMEKLRVIYAPSVFGSKRAIKGVTPPILLYSTKPIVPKNFSAGDKEIHRAFQEICVVGLIVDKNGLPTNIHIVRSLNPELDISALNTVRQYRLTPAMYQGHAVPVLINVEVNFQT